MNQLLSWEPSAETDTNDPDTETPEPSDPNEEELLPNLITSISPTYGSTLGGTEVTIFGWPLYWRCISYNRYHPANILSNAGSQRAYDPFSNLASTAEVRVDMSDGFGLSPEGFTYYEEGAGATGALGRIEMIEYLGGYWQDEFGNPITDGGK